MSESVLEHWLARERELLALHAQGPGAGVVDPLYVRSRSGLQWMEDLMHGRTPSATLGKTLDFLPVEIAPGKAVFQGAPGRDHLNPMGTVHGGWFATLLDSAMGCAVHTLMPLGRAYTTTDLNVKLIKALTPKVQRVRAEGRVLHCGRQLATAEARLVGPDGTLYAHATASCLVFDLPPQSAP